MEDMIAGPRPHPLTRVGTAGWSIPAASADSFPREGSHLQRYAALLGVVEINSSFHRPHQRKTYERWAASVPDGFRFAIKLPRAISHDQRLVDISAPLKRFAEEVAGLGDRRGPALLQLPPSLTFDAAVAARALSEIQAAVGGMIVCEPRHPTWFTPEAEALLKDHRVARVAADPAIVPDAASPGGWRGLAYFRLHGSPRIYRTPYGPDRVAAHATILSDLAMCGIESWTIYDNTQSGAATADALMLWGDLPRGALAAEATGE